jgi:hypothetical protein
MDINSIGIDPVSLQGEAPWAVNIDGDELKHLRGRYVSNVNDEDWDTVVRTAASILGRCPRPTELNKSSTGLAIGKVQSGKTLSYSVLTALAFDNNYSAVIVLAGTKKPLLDQTYARLDSDLVGGAAVITPFKNPTLVDSEVIENVVHIGGHVLVISLKRQNRINAVRDIFAQPAISRHPTLIIDDEGDEASLNTMFRNGKQSAVYKSILSLRSTLHSHAYVAYTATPQANLLVAGIDALSPDFGYLVYPGSGYCGGAIFFGERANQFVQEVKENEENARSDEITESLSNAIAIFLLGAAIRNRRGKRDWHSMLIHNSVLKAEHNQSFESVKQLISSWKIKLGYPENDPERQSLYDIFLPAYNELCRTVQQIPPWDILKEDLSNEIYMVEIWMVNSLPMGRDPSSTQIRLSNNIFVGGNMLGRGLTIQGLAVTYITRRAKKDTNADTLEQRARWFGYKKEYLDVCRIFLTKKLKENYTELMRHEDDFWDALLRNMEQGIHIRDWPRMFRLNSNMGLNPTRSNVAKYKRFKGHEWEVQNVLQFEQEIAEKNVNNIMNFFKKKRTVRKHFGSIEHTVIENCPTEEVISELLENVNNDGTDWDNAYIKEYLTRLLLSGELPSFDVLLMGNGEIRDRTLINGKKIESFSGPSNNYSGDRKINDGKVQFQVHIISPRKRDTDPRTLISSAFALYVPKDDPKYDLGYVVRVE